MCENSYLFLRVFSFCSFDVTSVVETQTEEEQRDSEGVTSASHYSSTSSAEFWNLFLACSITQWPPQLLSLSFETVSLSLSAEELNALRDITQESTLPMRRRECRMTCQCIEKRLDDAIRSVTSDACFVKLDSHSAKDGVYFQDELSPSFLTDLHDTFSDLVTHSPDHLSDNHLLNLFTVAFLKSSQLRFAVTNGREAILQLFSSFARIPADLDRHRRHHPGESLPLHIRRFHTLPPAYEFRAFVSNGCLTAISQYFYFCYFAELEGIDVQRIISSFFAEFVQPHLYLASCVIDFVLLPSPSSSSSSSSSSSTQGDPFAVKIIELNPFHYTTEGCMFDWGNAEDIEILLNGPLTYRYRRQEQLMPSQLLPHLSKPAISQFETWKDEMKGKRHI